MTQAGPGTAIKREQEEISPKHLQAFSGASLPPAWGKASLRQGRIWQVPMVTHKMDYNPAKNQLTISICFAIRKPFLVTVFYVLCLVRSDTLVITNPSFEIRSPVYKLNDTARGHDAALGRHIIWSLGKKENKVQTDLFKISTHFTCVVLLLFIYI